MRLGIVVGIVLATSVARADDAKDLLDKQVAAIVAGNAKAFADTFSAGGVAIFPIAGAEGFGSTEIEAAAKRWFATLPARAVKLDKPHIKDGVYEADLVGAGTPLRISGVVSSDGPHVIATHIGEPITDQAALAAAVATKLPKLPAIAKPSAKPPLALKTALAGHRWMSGVDLAVGSAPTELGVDDAGVRALLEGWNALSYEITAETHVYSGPDPSLVGGTKFHIVAGHVSALLKSNGKVVKLPMRVLVVAVQGGMGARLDLDLSGLALIHFSIAAR